MARRDRRSDRVEAVVRCPCSVPDPGRARRRHPLPPRPADQGRGRPIFCAPSRAELAGRAPLRQSAGTDGKVIYSTREAAEAAARELESLGARPLRSYLCGRSRRGHFHLTTDTAAPPEHAQGRLSIPAPRDRLLGLTAIGQMDPTSPAYTTTLSG